MWIPISGADCVPKRVIWWEIQLKINLANIRISHCGCRGRRLYRHFVFGHLLSIRLIVSGFHDVFANRSVHIVPRLFAKIPCQIQWAGSSELHTHKRIANIYTLTHTSSIPFAGETSTQLFRNWQREFSCKYILHTYNLMAWDGGGGGFARWLAGMELMTECNFREISNGEKKSE